MSALYQSVALLINGKPIKQYIHEGKTFIEAKIGTEYSIKVRNDTYARKLVVCTVDGINVINGEAGGKSQAGYILEPYNSFEIKGFRTSNSEVNAFVFSSKNKSYAANSPQTNGDISNCGVIGVQFYDEVHKPTYSKRRISWLELPETKPFYPDYTITHDSGSSHSELMCYSSSACASADSGMMKSVMRSMTDFDVGTKFSEKTISDRVVDGSFTIGSLYDTVTLYYASRQGLQNMGVELVKVPKVAFPDPFPSRFCKAPTR
jgi:hypothetical protein